MNYLTILNRTVNATLESGRIGTPLFVRWTASLAESKDQLKLQLVEMTAYTGHWLSAGLRRLYATGAESQGHISLTLEYVTGSSALLALTLAHNRPQMALAIHGNHGALYHNDFILPTRDGSLSPLQRGSHPEINPEIALDQELHLLLDTIERSLALHQPIEVALSGDRS